MVKRLERSNGRRKIHRLDFRKCLHLLTLAVAHHPRERGVVVQHALERIDDLVVERRLRILRKSTDKNADRVYGIELRDSVLCEDVHHARCDATIGHHRDALRRGPLGQLLLLEYDFRVATKIAEVNAGFDRALGKIQVEVVRNRAHHRVALAHQRQHGLAITDVERRRNEPRSRQRLEKRRQVIEVEVSQADEADVRILEQIIGAGRTLQAGAEHEHSHREGAFGDEFSSRTRTARAGLVQPLNVSGVRARETPRAARTKFA